MKIKVSFTVDVDPDAWALNYGTTGAAEIREDVRSYVENGITDHLDSLDLLVRNRKL